MGEHVLSITGHLFMLCLRWSSRTQGEGEGKHVLPSHVPTPSYEPANNCPMLLSPITPSSLAKTTARMWLPKFAEVAAAYVEQERLNRGDNTRALK